MSLQIIIGYENYPLLDGKSIGWPVLGPGSPDRSRELMCLFSQSGFSDRRVGPFYLSVGKDQIRAKLPGPG